MIDLSLPGYKYLGPFNKLNKGTPNNYNDFVALIHDIGYGKLQKRGISVYLVWNSADAKAYNLWKNDDYGGRLAKRFFRFKKLLADYNIISDLSYIGEDDMTLRGNINRIKKDKLKDKKKHPSHRIIPGESLTNFDQSTRKRPAIVTPEKESDTKRGRTTTDMTIWHDPNDPDAGTSDDVEPAKNLTFAASGPGASTRAHGRHGETEVERIPVTRFHPFPDTSQVLMTYYQVGTLTVPTGDSNEVQALSYRLNSIYDVQTITTYAADPAATADVADGTVNTPTMRPYWEQIYNYWSVVGSRYRFRIRADTRDDDIEFALYIYEHGLQRPPLYDGGTVISIAHQYRRQHKNLVFYQFQAGLPQNDTISVGVLSGVQEPKNELKNFITYDGNYNPRSIEHEVVEDELAQTWHKMTEVPPTPECVTFMVQKSPFSGDIAFNVKYEFTIEYIVQLKDLKAKFQYLDQRTDFPAITNFPAQAN